MKKILGIISILLISIIVFGCGSNSSAQVKLATQKINSSLDNIISQINRIEDINTDDLEIKNISNYNESNEFSKKGYESEEQNKNINNRYSQNNMSFESSIPTRNNFIKNTNSNLFIKNIRNNKKFNFLANNDNYDNNLINLSKTCCESSDEFSNTKKDLLANCYEAKKLLNELKNSNIKLSNNDIKTLNGYYEVVKQCVNNLKGCKNLKKNSLNLSKKVKNLTTESSSLNTEYLKLCNNINYSCTTCKNANESVKELIKYLNKILNKTTNNKSINLSNKKTTQNNSNYSDATKNEYIKNNRYLSKLNKKKKSKL